MKINVAVFLLEKQVDLKNDTATNAELAFKLGVKITELDKTNLHLLDDHLKNCDIIVDALFGTGLTRPISGLYKQTIEKINESKKFITAVDIPSGINSDTGILVGDCIRADLTLALALFKHSHLLFPAAAFMGELELIDIEIPPELVTSQALEVQVTEESDLRTWFHRRSADSHKGNYGHVLVIAGSRGKGGGCWINCLSCTSHGLRLGNIGLARKLSEGIRVSSTGGYDGTRSRNRRRNLWLSLQKIILLKHSKGMSAIAIGPGLSTEPETVQLLRELLPVIDCPLIIDADAVNALAQSPETISQLKTNAILTPHPKEMSRVTGIEISKIVEKRIEVARKFARDHSVTIVLKGAATIISQPNGLTTINPTGNPGMATAGSGDILSGIIASLVAQGFSSPKAAIAGTYLHGLSGDIFAQGESQTSLIAGDLLRTLPETIKTGTSLNT